MRQQINFLTPKEVAKILRLNILTIYEYIRSGNLHTIQLGRAYRIRQTDLDSFITSHLKKNPYPGKQIEKT